VNLLPVIRLAWGGLLVGVPGAVLGALTGSAPTRSRARVLRVLGARHLLQGSLDLARPTPGVLRSGAAVDLLHATTCAGAVVFLPGWRRVALLDGSGAVCFAAGGIRRANAARATKVSLVSGRAVP
jgi:hypothetical protein